MRDDNYSHHANIAYAIYARKSQAGDDRQVQSIPDQLREDEKVRQRYRARVIDTITEEHSAKEPGTRAGFNALMHRIEKGEINGIICWNLNRLSRNPVDSGRIQWLLQQGKIQSILTPTREYLPTDNALIFSVESGSANQDIINLKLGVRRGLDTKLMKGMAPISAPLGYLNTKMNARGENHIVRDPKRFAVIRKAWDLMLTGKHTPPQILLLMNNQWGLRTRRTKKTGDKPISRSTIYRIFTDPFYTGLFRYRGEIHRGVHDPMITLDEFDRVQLLLGREGRPRPQSHVFTYTGTMTCGMCGSSITATKKAKIVKTTNETKMYVMYHCTRRKKGAASCDQRRYISVTEIEKLIVRKIEAHSISSKFRDWAFAFIRSDREQEMEKYRKITETQRSELSSCERELSNLTTLCIRELIDQGDFVTRRQALRSKIARLKQQLEKAQAGDPLSDTAHVFEFAKRAIEKFSKDSEDEKKSIFLALGQDYTMTDEKLNIEANKWLIPIAERRDGVEDVIRWLEPYEYVDVKRRNEVFLYLRPYLRPLVDEVRTAIEENRATFHLPAWACEESDSQYAYEHEKEDTKEEHQDSYS